MALITVKENNIFSKKNREVPKFAYGMKEYLPENWDNIPMVEKEEMYFDIKEEFNKDYREYFSTTVEECLLEFAERLKDKPIPCQSMIIESLRRTCEQWRNEAAYLNETKYDILAIPDTEYKYEFIVTFMNNRLPQLSYDYMKFKVVFDNNGKLLINRIE